MAKKKSDPGLYSKIWIIAAELALLLSLFFLTISASPTSASTEAIRWSRVNIPTEGTIGNWVLADNSDVQHLTMATDGTLYAYAKGLSYTLYQSVDGGYHWSHTGNVQDSIVGIATSPADPNFIYYATAAAVYRSINGGQTFSPLPAHPGGAGSNNIEITSLAVTSLNHNIIAIGTRDTENSQFGGIYILDEEPTIPGWVDTNVGNNDVYAVAFSPNFTVNRQFVAVVTDEIDTLVTSKVGDAGWGAIIGNARLNKDNSRIPASVVVNTLAAIAFPNDYEVDVTSGNCVQFIAIDTGTGDGDVYQINGAEAPDSSTAIDLNIGAAYGQRNIDTTGLAVSGDATAASLLAGAADSAQTYFSSDGGTSWKRSRKETTGESETYVLLVPDAKSIGAYAATSGSDSALAISQDNANTWNQIGLIDTEISSIVDLAPSPLHSQDQTLFMLTFDGGHSLWRSFDDGASWERVLSSTMAGVDSMKLVALSPQYGNDSEVIFIAGSSSGSWAIWKSTNNGQRFTCYPAFDPATRTAIPIDTWAVVNDTTLFVGSYDGTHGLVYYTTNSGFFYSDGVPAGSQALNSMVLSPNYAQDGTLMIGNTNGWVYWSQDNGISFKSLPPHANTPPLSGSVVVAFDHDFANNSISYAASSTADKGIHRLTIGTDDDWESIDNTLPAGGQVSQLVVSSDGTMYASNSKAGSGMERCLNPTYSLGPLFETITRGLSENATLSGLWQQGQRLWSIDTTNTELLTFTGSLTSPVTLRSPANKESGVGTVVDHSITNIMIDWETLSGATSYQWQIDYDTDLSTVPDGFESTTSASTSRLPALEPDTTYYWRVRATEPVLSPWSEKWSFTTSLDTEVIALKLETPEAGATGVSIEPIFQWNAVAGADAYELLVSTEVNFENPEIVKVGNYALPSSAWQCSLNLDYETTYYWKVRAISPDTNSHWSAVGAFTTESPPTEITSTPEPSQPFPVPSTTPPVSNLRVSPVPTSAATKPSLSPTSPLFPAPPETSPATLSVELPIIPYWIVYLIGALLLAIILLLIITLILVLGIKRF